MSNLKKRVIGPTFITFVVVISIVMYVICAATQSWWPFGSSSDTNVTVQVKDDSEKTNKPALPDFATAEINASSTTVEKGKKITVSWELTNVRNVKFEGGGIKPRSVKDKDSIEIVPTETAEYWVKSIALRDGGTKNAFVKVIVYPALPDPVKDLHDTVYSEEAENYGAYYQLNLLWDSYCNASAWDERGGNVPEGAADAVYDGVSRAKKIFEITHKLAEEAEKTYKDLLHELRTNRTDYVTLNGDFEKEEELRCERAFSTYYYYGY